MVFREAVGEAELLAAFLALDGGVLLSVSTASGEVTSKDLPLLPLHSHLHVFHEVEFA